MRGLFSIIGRDLRLGAASGGEVMTLVLFFISIGVIVPFAIGPDQATLSRLAPAIIWIAAFLSMLLGLDRLFRPDHEDGTLVLLRHANLPLAGVMAGKLIAHWMLSALPLIAATPVLGVLLSLDGEMVIRSLISLALGTPALAALGALGAAITVPLGRGGLIAPVLITPLAVPVLIFGVGAISEGPGNGAAMAAMLFLAALSLVLTSAAPFVLALAIGAGED